jgi:hypothetical protein
VQGWVDCEPELDLNIPGFVEDDPAYTYKYEPFQVPASLDSGEVGNDTVWMLIQIDKISGDTIADKIYGYSPRQLEYGDMLSKSNEYYRISTNLFFVLIANHIISAVDAMISAKAHNDELLGRQSLWRRINLDQQVAFTDAGIRSSFGVRVRF